jgi:hypothetical protein
MGRGSLTVLLLPQVTGDQEWKEVREKMGRGFLELFFSCHKSLVTRNGKRREIRWAGDP